MAISQSCRRKSGVHNCPVPNPRTIARTLFQRSRLYAASSHPNNLTHRLLVLLDLGDERFRIEECGSVLWPRGEESVPPFVQERFGNQSEPGRERRGCAARSSMG